MRVVYWVTCPGCCIAIILLIVFAQIQTHTRIFFFSVVNDTDTYEGWKVNKKAKFGHWDDKIKLIKKQKEELKKKEKDLWHKKALYKDVFSLSSVFVVVKSNYTINCMNNFHKKFSLTNLNFSIYYHWHH